MQKSQVLVQLELILNTKSILFEKNFKSKSKHALSG